MIWNVLRSKLSKRIGSEYFESGGSAYCEKRQVMNMAEKISPDEMLLLDARKTFASAPSEEMFAFMRALEMTLEERMRENDDVDLAAFVKDNLVWYEAEIKELEKQFYEKPTDDMSRILKAMKTALREKSATNNTYKGRPFVPMTSYFIEHGNEPPDAYEEIQNRLEKLDYPNLEKLLVIIDDMIREQILAKESR